MAKKKDTPVEPTSQDAVQGSLFTDEDFVGAQIIHAKEVVSAEGNTIPRKRAPIARENLDVPDDADEDDPAASGLTAWSNQGLSAQDMILTENGDYVMPDYSDEAQKIEVEMIRAVRSYYAHTENENTPLVSLNGCVEGSETYQGVNYAIVYHGHIKVMIPYNKMSIPTQQSVYAAEMSLAQSYRKRTGEPIPAQDDPKYIAEIRNRVLQRLFGVDITYCVRAFDETKKVAVGSRTDSMRYLAKKISHEVKVNGDYKVDVGTRIRARIVATYRYYVVVCFAGIEMSLHRKDLTPRFLASLKDQPEYAPNNYLNLTIKTCERNEAGDIINMSAVAANLQTRSSALRMVTAGQKYLGYVSRINHGGAFVRILNQQVECKCSIVTEKGVIPRRGDMAYVYITTVDAENGICKGRIDRIEHARPH